MNVSYFGYAMWTLIIQDFLEIHIGVKGKDDYILS